MNASSAAYPLLQPAAPLRYWQTLRFKISALFVGVFLAGAGLLVFEYQRSLRILNDITLQQAQADVATEIAERIQPLIDRNASHTEILKTGLGISKLNPTVSVYIVDGKGQNVTALPPHRYDRSGILFDPETLERFLSSPLDNLPMYTADPESRLLTTFSAARLQLPMNAKGYVVALNESGIYDSARGVSRENFAFFQSVSTFGLSVVITLLLGIFLLSLLSRRFEALTSVVRSYRDGMMSARLAVTKSDEIGQLSQAINEMADRIQDGMGKLEHRDRLRRDLIANISHDLRAPVTQIMMGLDTVEGTAGSEVPALRSSVRLLETMLRELFDLAQLEAKEAVPQVGDFSIEELLEDFRLRGSAQAQAESKNLTVECEPDLPAVSADVTMIARVVANLMENALRYSTAGATITLGARGSGAPEESDSVLVFVSDTGKGIADRDLPKLFDRFYQGRGGADAPAGSSGLGLAIVKKILDLHGSTIHVESEEGKGSTFIFSLPMSKAARSA